MKPRLAAAAAVLFLSAAAPSRADDAEKAQLSELTRKVDILTGELERLKLGAPAEATAADAKPGFGPAASKVYASGLDKVSLGGYGEFVFRAPSRRQQNGDPSMTQKQLDLQRAVLYFGYKFNDVFLFNSEMEFEHAGSGEGAETRGEVAIEQAYLEARPWKELGARAGLVIVPLGLVNEVHEPTAFNGVDRPSVEQFIIPSTWRENGAGIFGEAGPVTYRSYALSGLVAGQSADPATDGFTADRGIRGGRTEGSNSPADDLAWASRVDVAVVAGVKAGAGLYVGRAAPGSPGAAASVALWETHAEGQWRGATLRALYAEGTIGSAADLDAATGEAVGRRLFGGYAEAAFDVLTLVPNPKGQSLSPFFRYERYDTQWKMPAGFAKDPANSRVEYTLGVTYKPIPKIAVKLDQQWKRNQAHTGVNQWNLGLGYIF